MKPLDGLRVVDLTVAVAGPVAAHILGDLGADVIRVEPPFARPTHHHDVAPRVEGAPDRPYNRVVSYNDLHRSKRSITLDLSREPGRATLLRLVAASDVVIENMAPRVLPSLGLSYGDLRAVNPRVVLVSMPAFGSEGPLRDRVSYGPGIDAMSGMSHLTGYPDRGPMNAALYFCDYNAGGLAALTTLAALRQRDRTGEGCHVELAMLDGELQLIADALMDVHMNGRARRRAGNARASMSPHGVYPCRPPRADRSSDMSISPDAWIAIACEDDEQWRALCGVIGRPELCGDGRFGDVVSRVRYREEVDAIVSGWTRGRDAHEAAEALQAAGVPASAVQTMGDLLADPQAAQRGALEWTHHPEAGAIPHTRVAFTLSRTPSPIERPAPVFAQDNDAVLRELLGMSGAEIEELAAHGIIRAEPPEGKPR